jgi:hypothetical protein
MEQVDEISGDEGAMGGGVVEGEGGLDTALELIEGGLKRGVEVVTPDVVELVGLEVDDVALGEGLVAEEGDEELVVGAVL